MGKLVESKLQKILLLIGGLLILVRLFNVPYYQTYTAVLQSIGIAFFTFVLLIITKDYKPQVSRKGIRIFLSVLALAAVAILAWYAYSAYAKYATAQQFHDAEVDYQNCLDKVAGLTQWTAPSPASETPFNHFFSGGMLMEVNPYFNAWENQGRPYFNQQAGHWEWGFMDWMMQNHSDFCSEFNPAAIKSFVAQELATIIQ